MDGLNEQKFVSLQVNVPLDIIWTCLYSCAGLRAGVWFFFNFLPHLHFVYSHPTSLLLHTHPTSYNCLSFKMSMWSYHWQSRYPFVLVPLWQWMYNNPRYTLGYYHNYYFGKCNTCLEGGFPPFPLPHLMTSRYPYH
jgi:hypothetical protein